MENTPKTPPKVSIGMPVYNGEPFIREALDSLLAQTFTDFELIISDNASTDGTEAICREYVAKDSRIRYVRWPENREAEANFKFVLNDAVAEYFMWAAADDRWSPKFIEYLLDGLNGHPEHGVAMSSIHRVREDKTLFDEVIYAGKDELTCLDYRDVFRRMIQIKSSPHIHIFIYGLFRTKLLRNLALVPFPNVIASDRIFMCEVALTTHFYSYPDVLHFRTVHTLNLIDRYAEERVGRVWKDKLRKVKYLVALLSRLVMSRNIPVSRKLVEIPLPWLLLVLRNSLPFPWFWRRMKAVLRHPFG